MRIQNIHGGVLYVRLAERHGVSLQPNQITTWKDNEANLREAKSLEKRSLVKILSDISSAVAPVLMPKVKVKSDKLAAENTANLAARLKREAEAKGGSLEKNGDADKEEGVKEEAPIIPLTSLPVKSPGFNYGDVSCNPDLKPDGFNFGTAS